MVRGEQKVWGIARDIPKKNYFPGKPVRGTNWGDISNPRWIVINVEK